jgi:hypothetical protein
MVPGYLFNSTDWVHDGVGKPPAKRYYIKPPKDMRTHLSDHTNTWDSEIWSTFISIPADETFICSQYTILLAWERKRWLHLDLRRTRPFYIGFYFWLRLTFGRHMMWKAWSHVLVRTDSCDLVPHAATKVEISKEAFHYVCIYPILRAFVPWDHSCSIWLKRRFTVGVDSQSVECKCSKSIDRTEWNEYP